MKLIKFFLTLSVVLSTNSPGYAGPVTSLGKGTDYAGKLVNTLRSRPDLIHGYRSWPNNGLYNAAITLAQRQSNGKAPLIKDKVVAINSGGEIALVYKNGNHKILQMPKFGNLGQGDVAALWANADKKIVLEGNIFVMRAKGKNGSDSIELKWSENGELMSQIINTSTVRINAKVVDTAGTAGVRHLQVDGHLNWTRHPFNEVPLNYRLALNREAQRDGVSLESVEFIPSRILVTTRSTNRHTGEFGYTVTTRHAFDDFRPLTESQLSSIQTGGHNLPGINAVK